MAERVRDRQLGGRLKDKLPGRNGRRIELGQEHIVLLATVVIVTGLAIGVPGFATAGNFLGLLKSMSVMGILGIGMAIVMIGGGIDLSMIASMAVGVSVPIQLIANGDVSPAMALLIGAGIVVVLGLINGLIIAFLEISPLFTTLATGLLFYGVARSYILTNLLVNFPPQGNLLNYLGNGRIAGIPMPVVAFAVVAIVVHQALKRLSIGRFIYVQGDNKQAAALSGIPLRPLIVLEYVAAAAIAYIAGLVLAGSLNGLDTSIVNSDLLFDVVLIVVLGGVSLVGGRGSVISVVIGALLIGVVTNGLTLLNVETSVQSIVTGIVLLGALILDNRLHPRDEETVRQGD